MEVDSLNGSFSDLQMNRDGLLEDIEEEFGPWNSSSLKQNKIPETKRELPILYDLICKKD